MELGRRGCIIRSTVYSGGIRVRETGLIRRTGGVTGPERGGDYLSRVRLCGSVILNVRGCCRLTAYVDVSYERLREQMVAILAGELGARAKDVLGRRNKAVARTRGREFKRSGVVQCISKVSRVVCPVTFVGGGVPVTGQSVIYDCAGRNHTPVRARLGLGRCILGKLERGVSINRDARCRSDGVSLFSTRGKGYTVDKRRFTSTRRMTM